MVVCTTFRPMIECRSACGNKVKETVSNLIFTSGKSTFDVSRRGKSMSGRPGRCQLEMSQWKFMVNE